MTQLKKKRISVPAVIALVVLCSCSVVSLVYDPYIFGENSIFHRAVSENGFVQALYEKIPALIRSIQIITGAILLNFSARLITALAFSKSQRSLTVSKLLYSFVKWVIVILTFLLVLGAWNVDTTAIIASAGIVTLAVSLGAQSLVADIISGLFIVIEGEYQVGDIVVIDDWRGTVKEIGIRTTKIEDAGGNIKIVNNSEIKTIINQTQALSVAKSTISIEYAESIPRVELIIKDNLDAVKAEIPEIIEGPYYKGVNALSASSVELLFVAKCQESDLYTVQRAMNRELKLLFDRHDIGIPFPQVTVNQPRAPHAPATESMTELANAFVDEQSAQSRHIEEEKQ